MPKETLDDLVKKLQSFDGSCSNIVFIPDMEKLKHIVGYLNSKGVTLASRISILLFIADMISLEDGSRTLYGDMYMAVYNKQYDFLTVAGLNFSEYVEPLLKPDEEDTEIHEEFNEDFLSGSDIAALNQAIALFPDWSFPTYKKVLDENKYIQKLKKVQGGELRKFVKWETLIDDFPEEKQKWLKEFDKAIVY